MAQFFDVNRVNIPRPDDLDPWLEFELERVSLEYNVPLRWTWAPDRERREMVGYLGNQMGYPGKVYAIPNVWEWTHVGWFRTKILDDAGNRKVLGYHQPLELPQQFTRNGFVAHWDTDKGEWWEPDIQKRQVAYARWVIETKGFEHERAEWEKMSFNPNSGDLIQELGPFPEEGLWVSLGPFLAKHHDAHLCCYEAHELMGLCVGHYREPNYSDVEAIERAIQMRNEKGVWVSPDSDGNMAAASEFLKRRCEEQLQVDKDIEENYRQHLHEAIHPFLLMTQAKSGPAEPPRFRKRITPQDIAAQLRG